MRTNPSCDPCQRASSGKDGAILGVVLVMLIVFSLLGMGLLQLSGRNAGETGQALSAEQAFWAAEAGIETRGAVMASDAFFPFRDGIDTAAEYGIATVIQPGGSMRDDEVITAANEHDMAMLLTGMRHFRH